MILHGDCGVAIAALRAEVEELTQERDSALERATFNAKLADQRFQEVEQLRGERDEARWQVEGTDAINEQLGAEVEQLRAALREAQYGIQSLSDTVERALTTQEDR